MNLEKINAEYIQFKSELEEAHKEIEKLESRANKLANQRDIHIGKKAQAIEKKNSDKERQEAENLKKIEAEIEKVKADALNKKAEIEALQEQINTRINKIRENPDMKRYLDECLSKRLERQISKFKTEKEEIIKKKQIAIEKKDRLIALKQLVTDHSNLRNNLKGIIGATNEIKKLKEDLDKYQNKDDITPAYKKRKIREINAQLTSNQKRVTKNKNALMAYISENGLNITEQDIDEVAKGELKVSKKGNLITLDESISSVNRQIKGCERQIKSYDRSISDHTTALEEFAHMEAPEEPSISDPRDPSKPSTSVKPKWYQFVQRFKNWKERRKNDESRDLDSEGKDEHTNPEEDSTSRDPDSEGKDEHTNPEEDSTKGNNWKDSLKYALKYKIVQDAAIDAEIAAVNRAKAEREGKSEEKTK